MSRRKNNSLTRMIFLRSALTVLVVSLACMGVMLSFLYASFLEESRESLRSEASSVAAGVEMNGKAYLDHLTPRQHLRITWIGSDGQVLFDTQTDPALMDNHAERPEILSALQTGYGESSRVSGTLSEFTIYYAVRIADGTVVRLSQLEAAPLDMLKRATIPLILLLLGAMLLAVALSAKTSREIVAPINRIDLQLPQSDSVYEELIPLTQRISAQNQQIQEQIRQQEEAHETQDRFRREFTANVSHELKTPLTSISGFAEIIRDGMVRPEDISRFAGNIYQEAQRLIVLVGDIINISRMDDESIPIQKESVDLLELSRVIVDRLQSAAKRNDVTLYLSGVPATIIGSYQVVDEMIYNLCDNAIKYNRPGGEVHISLQETEDGVCLAVRDTGIGIAPEHQDRVFERFYRVDKARSKQIGGTGLGLSIVKHGAAFHNAALSLESTLGVGTTICVTFPK